jgi:hypothetical protein
MACEISFYALGVLACFGRCGRRCLPNSKLICLTSWARIEWSGSGAIVREATACDQTAPGSSHAHLVSLIVRRVVVLALRHLKG